jgi:hypothetical protein
LIRRIPSGCYYSGKNIINLTYEVTGLISKVAKMATIVVLVKFIVDFYQSKGIENSINIGTRNIPIKIIFDKDKGPTLKTAKWVENLLKPIGSGIFIFGKSIFNKINFKMPKHEEEEEDNNVELIKELMNKLKESNHEEFDLDQDDFKGL